MFTTAAHPQGAATPATTGHHATCIKNNADARAELASFPAMPPGSRAHAEFITEDGICECMKGEVSPPDVTDPDLAYIEVSAVCLVSHAKRNFQRFCSSAYPEILTAMGYRSVSQSQLGRFCSCAQNVVDTRVTVEGTRQNLLNAYEEYQARVAGRSRQEIRRAPLHENSFEAVIPQTLRCAVQTIGAPG